MLVFPFPYNLPSGGWDRGKRKLFGGIWVWPYHKNTRNAPPSQTNGSSCPVFFSKSSRNCHLGRLYKPTHFVQPVDSLILLQDPTVVLEILEDTSLPKCSKEWLLLMNITLFRNSSNTLALLTKDSMNVVLEYHLADASVTNPSFKNEKLHNSHVEYSGKTMLVSLELYDGPLIPIFCIIFSVAICHYLLCIL